MTNQIPDSEKAQLRATMSQLRTIAAQLRKHAPSASVKADALATEVELRIQRLEHIR